MQITLSSRKLRPILLGVMAAVIAAGLLVELLRVTLQLKRRSGILPLFSLSYEANVPTWYSSALLFTCALVLAVVAAAARQQRQRFVPHWYGLAAGFLYISLDELVSIHEATGWLKLSGVLYFSWVIPAAALLLVLGIVYLKFLAHLPAPFRRRFVLCGGIYVAGAVGMELPLGWWTEREGTNNLGYALIDHVEEGLEMLGVNLFLLALLDYLAAQGVGLGFAPPAPAPAPAAEGDGEAGPPA